MKLRKTFGWPWPSKRYKIRVLSDEDMNLHGTAKAFYDDENRTLLLRQSREEFWTEDLMHEFVHLWIDEFEREKNKGRKRY